MLDKAPEIQPLNMTANMSKSEVEQDSDKPTTRSVRTTWVRWLMLSFGSLFLMGSYFCYDNVAPITKTLKAPPYDFSQF